MSKTRISRRRFVVEGSAVAVTANQIPMVYAAGQDRTLSVGLVGCGGRGTGAAGQCLQSSENVELVAMGDMFPHRLKSCQMQLKGKKGYHVDKEHSFIGFDAYKKVIASEIDMVILATPPGFRPMMFAAAIEAGKHVFFEKPVGVDPTGIRKVIEYGKIAKQKGELTTGANRLKVALTQKEKVSVKAKAEAARAKAEAAKARKAELIAKAEKAKKEALLKKETKRANQMEKSTGTISRELKK